MCKKLFHLKSDGDGLEAYVIANVDGVRFNAVFRCTDADQTIGVLVCDSLEAAAAKCRFWLSAEVAA